MSREGQSLQQGKRMEMKSTRPASELLCKRTGMEMRSWCNEGILDTICTFDPILLPVPGGKWSGRH